MPIVWRKASPGGLRRGAGSPPHLHGRRGARRAQPDFEEHGEDGGEVGDGGVGVDETAQIGQMIYRCGGYVDLPQSSCQVVSMTHPRSPGVSGRNSGCWM